MQKKLWFAVFLPAFFVACPTERQTTDGTKPPPVVIANADPEKEITKAAVSRAYGKAAHIPAVEQALQQARDDQFLRERRLRRARLP